MLHLPELRNLYRRLSDTPVLTVYLDGSRTDPAQRLTWRREYEGLRDQLLQKLETAGEGKPAGGAKELDPARSAAGFIDAELAEYDGFLPGDGWFGVASAQGLEYAEPVPIALQPMVDWREGPVVSPYLPVLGMSGPLLLVSVDHARGRVHLYSRGMLSLERELEVEETFEVVPGQGVIQAVAGATGFRGMPAKDAAQRALEDDQGRMFRALREAVSRRAGRGTWVVLNAPPDVQAFLKESLGPGVRDRILDGGAPLFRASDVELIGHAQRSLERIRQHSGGELVDWITEEAHPNGRGALGEEPVERALGRGAVDTLLVSATVADTRPRALEGMVGQAFRGGADVYAMGGPVGGRLDEVAGGVAARLRYPVP